MLSLLLSLASVSATYAFPIGKPTDYQVSVEFQGHIQILGGRDTDVTVQMQVEVVGKAADSTGHPQAVSDIKDMHVYLKEQEFPFKTSSITRFFPETTISFSPLGQVLQNDAPARDLPIRLPGLDAKRFPEITYVPIEFPAEGVEIGKSFTFRRPFNGDDVQYAVTPTKIDDDQVAMTVKVSQKYTLYEDSFGNPVDSSAADTVIPTDLEGSGTAVYDRHRQIVTELHLKATATGTSKPKTGAGTPRHLDTSLDVVASPAKP